MVHRSHKSTDRNDGINTVAVLRTHSLSLNKKFVTSAASGLYRQGHIVWPLRCEPSSGLFWPRRHGWPETPPFLPGRPPVRSHLFPPRAPPQPTSIPRPRHPPGGVCSPQRDKTDRKARLGRVSRRQRLHATATTTFAVLTKTSTTKSTIILSIDCGSEAVPIRPRIAPIPG
jgi:hypothetical protein